MLFKPTSLVVVGTIAATSLFMSACNTLIPEEQDPHQPTAITNVRIIDGTGGPAQENMTVIFQDGRILSITPAGQGKIPPGANEIDGEGKSLMPALIANHSHVGNVNGMKIDPANYTKENVLRQLQTYQKFGISTIVSLGTNNNLLYEVRKDIKEGKSQGPDLFTADSGIGVSKGAPPMPQSFGEDFVKRPTNVATLRVEIKKMRERGADMIKIWYDDFLGTLPKMKPEFYRAAIDEAHKQQLPLMAHVYYLADAKKLVHAGADVLAHGIRYGEVDQDFAELLAKKKVAYIPTLGVDESFYVYGEHPEWLKDPFFVSSLQPELKAQIESAPAMKALLDNPAVDKHRAGLKQNQKNLMTLFNAGVLVGFGTDSGANPYRIPGFAEHRELELMVQAGLTPVQAIQVATSNAAKIMKLEDRGVLKAGKRADLILVTGQPDQDILATRKIAKIWMQGSEIKR